MGRTFGLLICLLTVVFSSRSWASDIDGLSYWKRLEPSLSAYIPWASEVVLSEDCVPSGHVMWICHKGAHLLFGVDEEARCLFGYWPVATGRNSGQKRKVGDMRTPEGLFPVQSVHDASYWQPYRDKKTGDTVGYGPWFIRLKTPPWSGIGIHGTDEGHLSEIGTDASHGCIRMKNEDLLRIKEVVRPGQKVLIVP